MSPRSACLVLALILGAGACGGGGGGNTARTPSGDEPKNAKEKQLLEAKASGEIDDPTQAGWGKWRYTGDRNNCFYVAGRRCFKTEGAACKAMRCKAGEQCKATGAGPATLSCAPGAKSAKGAKGAPGAKPAKGAKSAKSAKKK